MNFFTVKGNIVENKSATPFEIEGETTLETKKKIEVGYRFENGIISPPDTTIRDKRNSAWQWAIEKLYSGQLAGQAQWITAIKYPHLKQFMTDQDWNNLISVWETSNG